MKAESSRASSGTSSRGASNASSSRGASRSSSPSRATNTRSSSNNRTTERGAEAAGATNRRASPTPEASRATPTDATQISAEATRSNAATRETEAQSFAENLMSNFFEDTPEDIQRTEEPATEQIADISRLAGELAGQGVEDAGDFLDGLSRADNPDVEAAARDLDRIIKESGLGDDVIGQLGQNLGSIAGQGATPTPEATPVSPQAQIPNLGDLFTQQGQARAASGIDTFLGNSILEQTQTIPPGEASNQQFADIAARFGLQSSTFNFQVPGLQPSVFSQGVGTAIHFPGT